MKYTALETALLDQLRRAPKGEATLDQLVGVYKRAGLTPPALPKRSLATILRRLIEVMDGKLTRTSSLGRGNHGRYKLRK